MATERSSLTAEGLGLSLPYSIEAEQAVLGAAILNHDLVPQMVSRLRQEFFYSRQNGEIFAELVAMSNMAQAVDFVTLLGRVTDAGIFENGEAVYSSATISHIVKSEKNGKHYWIGNLTPPEMIVSNLGWDER